MHDSNETPTAVNSAGDVETPDMIPDVTPDGQSEPVDDNRSVALGDDGQPVGEEPA